MKPYSTVTGFEVAGKEIELELDVGGTILKSESKSDTSGNKQDASGHRNASMLNIYDVQLKTVEPSSD